MRTFTSTVLVLTAVSIAASAAATASAQRYTILLDPARGGTEYGARIDDHTYEKQVTLDLANRLRSLLNARDFNVVLTRETDSLVTNEARAAAANTSKPVACLLLHSTAVGTGLHLYTTSLEQAPPTTAAVPWDEAQSPFVQRSQRLGNELTTAFSRARIPVSSGRTWLRPLDNMQCPAVAIEIAPESTRTLSSDHAYQNRIASTIAGALLFWRGHTDVMQSILPPPPAPEAKPKPPVASTPAASTPVMPPAAPPVGSPAVPPTVPRSKPDEPARAQPAPVHRGTGAPE